MIESKKGKRKMKRKKIKREEDDEKNR